MVHWFIFFLCVSFDKVNMEPCALKSDYNAVIHFIKHLKRSMNLAVTNPALSSSLENVRYVVLTYQEGTLKKIHKNRVQKTTRNLQEGTPFTLNDVKRQFEYEKLVNRVCYSTE